MPYSEYGIELDLYLIQFIISKFHFDKNVNIFGVDNSSS